MDTAPLKHPPEFEALCADVKTRIREIPIDEAGALLAENGECCLIDVRDKDEYESYHIDGARHLSKGWIEAKIHTVAPDKDSKIILYCGSGNRSALAADNLQKMGYTNIHSMAGGIKAWVNAGKNTIKN